MAEDHTVKAGECLTSIAEAHGFLAGKLWDHPKNAALKDKRKDPNVLLPGDVVHIPDRETFTAECETGKRHTFKRKGIPAKFRLQLVDDDEPEAGVPWELRVAGQVYQGETDEQGYVEAWVPAQATEATLKLGAPGEEREVKIALGHLPPAEDLKGVQARLANLGFYAGAVDGTMSDETRAAILAFQRSIGHPEPSGEPDPDTLAALVAAHEQD